MSMTKKMYVSENAVPSQWHHVSTPVGFMSFNQQLSSTAFLFEDNWALSALDCSFMAECKQIYEECGPGRCKLFFGYDTGMERLQCSAYKINEIKLCPYEDTPYALAAIKLKDAAAGRTFDTLNFKPFKYRKNEMSVIVPHHPVGQTKKISAGIVTEYYPRLGMFGHTAKMAEGALGAPVILRNKVIGVQVANSEAESFAIPAESVRKTLGIG
jgi:hypothetical protein